jgi:Double zinc ribbon
MSDAFNERLRLIRFRRKREHTRFRDELRIIPKWLVVLCLVLYIAAIIIGLSVNYHGFRTGGDTFPDNSLRNDEPLSQFELGGVITAGAIALAILFFSLGYVYRDAKRRGMNPALWTLLVLLLSGGYFFIGFIIYLLVRDPLPYTCPQCAASVNARFNYCPNCKTNLQPACSHCQHEVADTDKFCPFCGNDLSEPPAMAGTQAYPTGPAIPPPESR